MSDHTTKDFFGDGYTTYHDDGSTSHTTKDFFGDGYTTYHSDGSTSHTSKDFFGDGTTTYHSDGSTSYTSKDFFGNGYTTYHSDGSTSHTSKDFFGNGYTTYNTGGYSGGGYAGGGYSGGYAGGYPAAGIGGSLNPGIIGPLDIFGAILGAGAVGFLLWWDSEPFPLVLFAMWAVVLAAGMIERNRRNDYREQDAWHNWSMLLALLLGIYLLYERAGAPGDTLQMIAHYLVPLAYTVIMAILCVKAAGAVAHDWIAGLFILFMAAAWFITIYTGYAGYEGVIGVVIDVILAIIGIIALFTALGCIKEHRLAILPVFLVGYGIWYIGRLVTGFYGFHLIIGFIAGLIG